jgi:hypothetical protein
VEVGRSVLVGGDDKVAVGAGAVEVSVAVGSTVAVAVAGGAAWRSNKLCANHPIPHATPPRTIITAMHIKTLAGFSFNIAQFPSGRLLVLSSHSFCVSTWIILPNAHKVCTSLEH